MLDVKGSIHVNGFINFLKNGETPSQAKDNPSGQLTENSDAQKLEYTPDPVGKKQQAAPMEQFGSDGIKLMMLLI